MKEQLTRRDFLKLAGMLPISVMAPRFLNSLDAFGQNQANQPNVLVIIFDAWSAYHMSMYGYQRDTMPNLSKLADRAIVYHNHYAGGNYTTPGTASLLTGTHPWTHRAFQPGGMIPDRLVSHNVFASFENYYRITYSHNLWANLLLRQFEESLDEYIPKKKYFLTGDRVDDHQGFFLDSDTIIPKLFGNDEDIALVSWIRALEKKDDGFAYSLFLAPLYEKYRDNYYGKLFSNIEALFPRGIPKDDYDFFLLETAIDAIGTLLTLSPQPFMGYFHFWPPHAPYNTHKDFVDTFKNDGFIPPDKPLDLFGDDGPKTKNRTEYDEYFLYVDREFGSFYNQLEQSGLLENTYIVLTSDHGEMFERGIEGHRTPVLYEPIIRVPLMIFEPGRESRTDIYESTSAVDILPTLLHLTGQKPVEWTEGKVLAPFSSEASEQERSVYVVHADKSEQHHPLSIATLSIRKGDYKLMYFFGYDELKGQERIELYNIKVDPEELNDLYDVEKEIGLMLLNELKAKLAVADKPNF